MNLDFKWMDSSHGLNLYLGKINIGWVGHNAFRLRNENDNQIVFNSTLPQVKKEFFTSLENAKKHAEDITIKWLKEIGIKFE